MTSSSRAREAAPHARPSPPVGTYTAPASPLDGAVLLVTPWYGGASGGVAVVTDTIVGALLRVYVRVVVLTLHPSAATESGRGRYGEPVDTVCVYGPEVRRRGVRGALGYHRRALQMDRTLRRLVRSHRICVAHLHFGTSEYTPLLASLGRLGIPSILTFHGSDAHQLDVSTPAGADVDAVVAAATQVTAISDGLLATTLERLPAARGKARTVRNPAPLDLWDAASASTIDAPRDTNVLFVGNLKMVKGPDFLLEAFTHVARHRPDTTLSIVGCGEMEAQLRGMVAAAGLAANVRFHGRTAREHMPMHFRGARVLAVPSRAEGLSLAAIEAQLYGTPVVGTALGGIPEAVAHGETGTLVPFGDPRAFADAILALLNDQPAWACASANARAWAVRTFDPAIAAARYVALYQALAESAPPPSPTVTHVRADHVVQASS